MPQTYEELEQTAQDIITKLKELIPEEQHQLIIDLSDAEFELAKLSLGEETEEI